MFLCMVLRGLLSNYRLMLRRFSYFLLSFMAAIALGIWNQPSLTIAVEPPPQSPEVRSSDVQISNTTPAQLLQQGQSHYDAGQFTTAVEIWQQAAQSFAEQGHPLQRVRALNNMAIAHHQLGHWSQADAALGESLAVLDQLETDTEIRAAALGQVFNTRGSGWLLRSQPTQALTAFEQAADYYTDANDTQGWLRCQINQAQALQSLGFYRRALTLLNDLQPDLLAQSDQTLTSLGLRDWGNLLRITGDLEQSETVLQQALDLAQSEPHPHTVASILYGLGQTTELRGVFDLALDHYQHAAAIAPNPILKVQAQVAQFTLLSKTGQISAATPLLSDLQTQLETLPSSRLLVYAQLELAHQVMQNSTNRSANGTSSQLSPLQVTPQVTPLQIARWLAIAQQHAQSLQDLRAESFALGYLGELYLKQQQYPEAETTLLQALDRSEEITADDITYRWQWQLGRLNRQRGQDQEAIAAYSNAVDTLQRLRSDLVAINPDLQFNFREQVEPVYRELVDLLLATADELGADELGAQELGTDQSGANELETKSQTQLLKARDVIESLQLAELENFFREPCVAVRQQIDQVVDTADSPTAVLYPIILPDRLEVILKLPNQPLRHTSTLISQAEFEAKAEALINTIALPYTYTLKEAMGMARELYDWLLKPVEADLANANIDTLVFVQDGILRNIPMAVLYDGQQYLVERYALALAPGLKLVDPKPLSEQKLAAIAAGLSKARHGFQPLASVQTEVESIQTNLPSRVLLDQSFTQSALETAINQTPFPIVHLATHGQFSSNPENTFILAWDNPIQINTLNRLLRNSEQSRQDAIELLVLSACETASGDKRAALGLAGVAVRAGARSTLASLWTLDDETGALFMETFYQILTQDRTTKANALRNAQLSLLHHPEKSHPRYWAPYVLVGNWF